MYKTITIKAGSGGWGGPLTIVPTEKCNKILSVTGGGIHPVAQKIAEMTGGEAIDGFKETLPDDEVLVAVVDCGGTARCGVYPKKGIFTVNIEPVGKAGPLAKYITPEIYVSAVTENDIFESDYAGHYTESIRGNKTDTSKHCSRTKVKSTGKRRSCKSK